MGIVERIDCRIEILRYEHQLRAERFFEHRMQRTSIVTDNFKPVEDLIQQYTRARYSSRAHLHGPKR